MLLFLQEFNFQIERDFGCRCLSLIPRTSPNDREIQVRMRYTIHYTHMHTRTHVRT